MSVIDNDTVIRVASLARLKLSDADAASYSKQLASIISYISKLNETDTSLTPPTSHPLGVLKNVFRTDIIKDTIGAEEALRNAPSRQSDFFKVPAIIEGK